MRCIIVFGNRPAVDAHDDGGTGGSLVVRGPGQRLEGRARAPGAGGLPAGRVSRITAVIDASTTEDGAQEGVMRAGSAV